ncbi:MAG: metallophosphoesterase [Clostridia bacterium]|nr:metallophosphoesterase [Clostridia bacterium]
MMNTVQELLSQQIETISGAADFPPTHVFRFADSGIIARCAFVESKKGGDELHLLQLTDIHLSYLNLQDFEEKNPVVMSTYDERRSSFNREDVFRNLDRVMSLAPLFDKTIVTGDVMDYLTWGALEYTQRYLYDRHPAVLLSPGGHDVSRRCQGKVADTSSLASRYEMLKTVWQQDVYYHSEVLGDKVMLVLLNNGENRYYAHQTEKLRADIERARRENLIILLFQHEPICTHNEKETAVTPLWVNLSPAPRDYCNGVYFIGNTHKTEDESMEMYRLITESADVIKAVFCGHMHNEVYTEIAGTDYSSGEAKPVLIPQYILDAAAYDKGHMLVITVR